MKIDLKERLLARVSATKDALPVFEEEQENAKLKLEVLLVQLRDGIFKILETNEGVELFELNQFMSLVAKIVEADRHVDVAMQNVAVAARQLDDTLHLLKEEA